MPLNCEKTVTSLAHAKTPLYQLPTRTSTKKQKSNRPPRANKLRINPVTQHFWRELLKTSPEPPSPERKKLQADILRALLPVVVSLPGLEPVKRVEP